MLRQRAEEKREVERKEREKQLSRLKEEEEVSGWVVVGATLSV